MKVILNGKETQFGGNTTLLAMLNEIGINPKTVVIEYNYEIPQKKDWGAIILKENDNIEIVKFIGGG